MMKQTKVLSYRALVALTFMVYFFSYAMRLDFSACIVSLTADLGLSNTAASAAVTGSYITYGIGQVLFGVLGDRVPPVRIITVAMIGTVLVNLFVSGLSSIVWITVLWCFNGIFQAMLWPPLCRFLSDQLEDSKYSAAITLVGTSGPIGTVFVFFFVPIVLKFAVWRTVFRLMALFGVLMLIVWILSTRSLSSASPAPVRTASSETAPAEKRSFLSLVLASSLIPIFVIILLQGSLRDGIQTWLPSLVKANFALDDSDSVLSSVFMPLLGVLSISVAGALFQKIKNELKTAFYIFLFAALASVPLAVFPDLPFLLSLALASLISGCMHGVNLMVISLVPKRFARYGMISTFSGLVNSFTYVGASLSGVGFAALSDHFGWGVVLTVWSVIAILGTLLCLAFSRPWSRFIEEA